MKAKELRNLSTEELLAKLDEFKSEIIQLKIPNQLLVSYRIQARIKTVKRDIAKVKTVLAERKLNEARA